jgi:hypothetical protein
MPGLNRPFGPVRRPAQAHTSVDRQCAAEINFSYGDGEGEGTARAVRASQGCAEGPWPIEGRSMRSNLAAALIYAALLGAPLPPRSGPLWEEIRHAPSAEIDPKTKVERSHAGYVLDQPLITNDWVVCELWYAELSGSHVPPKTRPKCHAFVAVNLKNGQTRQLSAPENRGVEFAGFVPLKGGECGVVLSQPRVLNGNQDGPKDRSFWRWSPQTGAVVAGGPWTPVRLLDFAVDPGICEIATVAGHKSGRANIRIRDVQSGKSAEMFLDDDAQLLVALHYYGNPAPQTLIPRASGRSFIVMHRTADIDVTKPESIISECVDPTAPDGRRWRLRSSQIKEKVGHRPREVYPISGTGPASPVVGVVVESDPDGDLRVDCLTISSDSGALLKSWRIESPLCGALMSVDGKLMACTIERDNQQRQVLEKEASIFDVATGKIVSKLDLSNHFAVSLFAFQDERHIFGLGPNDLWRFAIPPQKTHELLFRLDPSAPDW